MTTTIASMFVLVRRLRAMPQLVQWLISLQVMFSCALFSGCSHLVKVSSAPGAVLHTGLVESTTNWEGERVQVALAPSLRGEQRKYLANSEEVFLANSLRERGLRHVYKINGVGTPLVVYARNPEATPREQHYPHSGIVLGLTAVKEDRPAQLPLLKLYDSLDPGVVRSIYGKHPVAANYTATLAVLYSHARKLADSAAGRCSDPIPPRYPTGIYLTIPTIRTRFRSCLFMV